MSLASRLRAIGARPFRTVGPQEAAALVAGGAVLLDVRTSGEWKAGHVPGARHVPLDRVASSAGGVPPDRTIVTVCQSGLRSARAAQMLAGRGWDVVNLGGGMSAWVRAGLPVVGARR